jgi:DNA-binding MarR family transcriptional regulator
LQRTNRFSKTAGRLGNYLGLTKGMVSQTLNALEGRGLTSKRINRRDRRSEQLSLTPKALKQLQDDPLNAIEDAITSLEHDQQVALDSSLQELLNTRLFAQQRQPFGQCYTYTYFAAHHANGQPHYCQLPEEPIAAEEATAICYEQRSKSEKRDEPMVQEGKTRSYASSPCSMHERDAEFWPVNPEDESDDRPSESCIAKIDNN